MRDGSNAFPDDFDELNSLLHGQLQNVGNGNLAHGTKITTANVLRVNVRGYGARDYEDKGRPQAWSLQSGNLGGQKWTARHQIGVRLPGTLERDLHKCGGWLKMCTHRFTNERAIT